MQVRTFSLWLITLSIIPVFAQKPKGVSASAITNNRLALKQAQLSHKPVTRSLKPKVVVFVGDTVIPQIAEGDTWQTSFIIRNLEPTLKHCQVLFFNDDGSDLVLPIAGVGSISAVDVTLDPGGSAFFETTGSSPGLLQGWASILKDNSDDSIGGMAVFRQSIPDTQPSEAVVPVVSQFDDHFVLIFDNTNTYLTSMAIANPTLDDVLATATIMDEFGNVIDQQTLSLPSFNHDAFSIPDRWPSTIGVRGSIEFTTSGFGIAVLGLRFNPYGSFTSFNVLENFSWVVSGN